MLGSRLGVLDPSRAGGARGRELPAFLKGTVLDPDYVPPQRPADDDYGDTYGDACGDAGQQNTRQQFLHGRSTDTSRSTDGPRSTDTGPSTGPGRSTDTGRSADGGRSAGPEVSGEPVGSGVLVTELKQLASRIAMADLPDSTGLCLGETEEILFAQDRLDSAIAARVGRIHATGEAKSAGSGGHASTSTWLRASAGMTSGGASRLIRLATQLARLPTVRDRLARGTLAEGSADAISQVTTHLNDAQAALAEPILLDLADNASPAEILKAGRYLRELLDPGTLDDDAETDYATRSLLVRPSSTGGLEGEFRLPREAGARLREFLTAYARPKGKDDDRPLRVRQADALSALLTKKVTTELLVLVRAESLPTDHPTHDHPTTDHITGHPTHDADSTHTASTAASATPATGAPPSQSTSGRADTADPNTAAADTANADTTGSSDTRPGTPPAGDDSTCRASGPRHTGGTGSAGAGADSTSTGSAGAGTGRTDTGSAGAGADSMGIGSAGAGADSAGTGSAGAGTDSTDMGSAGAGADSAGTGSAGAGTDSTDMGSAGAGPSSAGTGSAGAGTDSTDMGSAGAGPSSAGTGSAGAGTDSTSTGSAGAGVGSVGTGERPVSDACRTCGHGPDRLAPGLLIATGQLLPISDVHRLARTSRLVRLVVDAQGQVLDMGRAVRLATPAQRRAVLARYATCYREGCPIPADMAEIDHVKGWAEGGTTDLDLLAPACTWHNRDKATHPDRYRTRRNHDGTWTLLYHGKRNRFAGRFRR
ncbi:hypothetical protein GCM10009555_008350 [Acrocarpospora macrocephala]|uniref:DUF222 domain-containing protein n=2 Tax=Acrocarpospora macrocephala TaxID=150177 RepID=UPI0031D7DF21